MVLELEVVLAQVGDNSECAVDDGDESPGPGVGQVMSLAHELHDAFLEGYFRPSSARQGVTWFLSKKINSNAAFRSDL